MQRVLEESANKGNPVSMYNLGVFYRQRGQTKEAIRHLRNALKADYTPAALQLSEILSDINLTEKESLYQQAIKSGVDGATALYVNFLAENHRFEEAQAYEAFLYNEDDESSEKTSESSETDEDLEAVAEPASRKERDPKENNETLTKASPSLEAHSKEFFLYGEHEQAEKFQIPSLSKRTLRHIERAKKKLTQPSMASSLGEMVHRTYKDIDVFVDPEAVAEVSSKSLKVKQLLSCLANGEGRRGKLESLAGYDNLYSMRITQTDRLVFKILEGDIKTGIVRLQILCAKGHYSNLRGTRLSRDTAKCEKF